ncbi:MAG TPA: aryl-sulfate sulfotransferase [Candidatus Onthousia excrementipullorum]|uniref:Aryl-sulfate sulfotransferase n=1 Tax=Candidatus Onthousia excrementipullorum TaxID=2840884 RepID=A0A9D1J349_9FIRM|nr:aryl-sulfate sulfotransferase [Candidatus Onthousia excrementipullorum]
MKKKKFIIIVIVIILILVVGCLLVFNNLSTNSKEVKVVSSLIEEESKLEEDFSTELKDIDNADVIVNPYDISPLTALIIFKTDEAVSPKVTIEGDDELSTYEYTFDEGTEHYLPIYGLYPDRDNTVVVEYGDVSKEFTITTEALPDDFILPTSVDANKDELSNDLYFFTPSSNGYTCAYDVNGDVRWYLTINSIWEVNRLDNGHMMLSTERLVNSPYYMTGLYEMDMLGKIYKEYSLPGGYHHDYYEMPNGNLLVASDDFTSGDGTVEDYIVELDRDTGEVVKTFDLKDVLNMEDGKSENWIEYDWFHNNSVWYDEETNSITLSGRHQDAVINIDYDSGDLNWIIGDPTNWSEEYQKYFFTPVGDDFEWQWSQHAAMITPEGYVFIFDNGNNKSKNEDEYVPAEDSYSRGVMYKIDTEEMTIEQVFEYGKERGSEFYSPYISDVDYLESEHYIIHSGGIVYVDGKNSNQPAGISGADRLVSDTVEYKDGEVIFEIVLPTNNYRVEKMSLYSENESFKLSKAERVGSLGETEVTNSELGFILNSKDFKDIEEEHNISITKEVDRLVFTGKFKRGIDVNVILYKNGTKNIYNVSISKKPYTALCVDIFTEEETKEGISVTKYINEDGLSGKYSIYVEVDGTIYNTNRYVEF